jgi:hypothetical protein
VPAQITRAPGADSRYSKLMRTVFLSLLLAFALHAQPVQDSPARPLAPSNGPPLPADLQDVVKRQFGPAFEISLHRAGNHIRYARPDLERWTPFLTGDLDGDGVEDAVIVVHGKGVLSHAVQHNYKVLDPYYAYNGFGDVKVTAGLDSEDPSLSHIVLIIHGSGAEAWRAAVPKAKFAVINLPFDNLSLTMVGGKGKNRLALNLESTASEIGAVIVFDGKKYKYRDVTGK